MNQYILKKMHFFLIYKKKIIKLGSLRKGLTRLISLILFLNINNLENNFFVLSKNRN